MMSAIQRFSPAGFGDDRVLLQGFYWESYRHGNQQGYGNQKWYDIVRSKAGEIRDGRFDLVWLPPPSFSGKGAGYNPKAYFDFNNDYGDIDQHRLMLETLLKNGVEPIADVVINHRDGTSHWADFKNPDWPFFESIKNSDEFFKKLDSGFFDQSEMETIYGLDYQNKPRGNPEYWPPYVDHSGTTYEYTDFRDIDHSSPIVQYDILRYLLSLRSFGYRGWRFDMVHGFLADKISLYNIFTKPSFSVGEFEWDKQGDQRGWIWYTATKPNDMQTSSNVFDFNSHFILKDNKANYLALYGFGNGIGMVGDNTDGHPWKNRAVTFLENHDTGYRTHEDGNPQKDHVFDSFQNSWEVEQAYAYILTHPGIPSVYWKHYFDWGSGLQNKIKAIINARKVAGVNASSSVYHQENARQKGVYAAKVKGYFADLCVRVGGNDDTWNPLHSSYQNYLEYAEGEGWKVWVNKADQNGVIQAPLKSAYPIPKHIPAEKINVMLEYFRMVEG